MSDRTRIKETLERNVKAMELRRSVGRGTAVTRCRLVDGFHCEVEEGPFKLTVDMSEKSGGMGLGPNPGVLGRGALASCLVVGYQIFAHLRGVPLTELEVEVQADYDSRGDLGVGDVPPGYEAVRVVVSVASPASEERVRAVLAEADRHSAYLSVFQNPHPVSREIRFVEAATTGT